MMNFTRRITGIALSLVLVGFVNAKPPESGERIALVGNGLGERFLEHPWFETELHLRYPEAELVVRNLSRSGNTPGFRPHPSRNSQWAFPGAEKFRPEFKPHQGKGHHPTPDEWLSTVKADTILAFFGYNESFDGPQGLKAFEGELGAFIDHTLAQKYNGESAPRLVMISPIAYEDLSAQRDLPDGKTENENLAAYTAVIEKVAAAKDVEFIDVFKPTREHVKKSAKAFTRNGFLPTAGGYRWLGVMLADQVYGKAKRVSKADPVALANVVRDKNWFWFNDYRMLNGVHVDGRRYKPFGPQNYPAEIKKMRALTEIRDRAIWAKAQGKSFDVAAADAKTPKLPEVPTNYKPGKKNGDVNYKYGQEALDSFTLPEGYQIELFASEKEFPNLANPVQLTFDNRGRLWVAVMPSYPHYKPGNDMPNDKLLIYEDTNGDGKADRETVFADGLHLPIGFEFAPEGVYVSQEPSVELLRDTDGDDQADTREVVLTGFDTHDTHHAIGAFATDPSGAIIMEEGTFLHSNVETPYGPVRGIAGGFYRFSPQRTHLERTAQLKIPNPWGMAFDRWGQDFFLHTSGPTINWMLPGSVKPEYGQQMRSGPNLAPKSHRVRPTSGMEFVSSAHFPDEVQGDMLLGNAIGFLGIKQHKIVDDGTGYHTEHRHDLVTSSDGNFRPVDMEFAPDGSLYLADWHNVLIGHMQHNARDPHRDHSHGRIYRITYPSRPLVEPVAVDGQPLEKLFENLKGHQDRVRSRTRREIREHSPEKVIAALNQWLEQLDPKDPDYEHHRLEGLWVSWGVNQLHTNLLRQLLNSADHRVRAAAVRVLRYNFRDFDDHTALLMAAAGDAHGRVRLEAAVAASWLDTAGAKEVVASVAKKPVDDWMKEAVQTAAARLAGREFEAPEENPAPKPPTHLSEAEQKQFLTGHELYHREGHCATCHQPDGEGLPGSGFPPIAGTRWVQGDEDRLIKLTLHGLMGPIEVDGVKYPGQVPMTPFAGLLDDDGVAAVLTYVRNSFGNKASAIDPEKVKQIRKETGIRSFYSPEELLKEHPMVE